MYQIGDSVYVWYKIVKLDLQKSGMEVYKCLNVRTSSSQKRFYNRETISFIRILPWVESSSWLADILELRVNYMSCIERQGGIK